jgi:hypothetical protein
MTGPHHRQKVVEFVATQLRERHEIPAMRLDTAVSLAMLFGFIAFFLYLVT